MTEAQLWIAKAEAWRIAAQTARDPWTEDQLLWLAAEAERLSLEGDQMAWPVGLDPLTGSY
jgi:hypothetical protein